MRLPSVDILRGVAILLMAVDHVRDYVTDVRFQPENLSQSSTGRVPLFFYVSYVFVAHAAGLVLALLQSGELRRIPVTTDPGSIPAWYGLALPGVYLAWALVVVALYRPCRWFARLKATRSDWWIHYL